MSDFPYRRSQHQSDCLRKNEYWEVWRGTDLTDPSRKIIWKEFHFAKEAFCLQSEIRLQPNLHHPFIAPVLASKELEKLQNKANFVMIFECFPYVLESLSWENEGLAEEYIVDFLGMAISALVHLQNEGIAHRDIKPDNLYIAQDGTLRVGDFGTAKECSSDTSRHTLDKGTPLYMSPKLRETSSNGRHNLFKSDVYSLGLTCLQLIWKLSQSQLEQKVKYTILPDLPGIVEGLQLSDGLKEMVIAMLTYEERNRPDFFQLMYMYANLWPEKRRFFSNQLLRKCDACGNVAVFLCICSDKLPGFCADCIANHKATCEDTYVSAADIQKIKQRRDVNRLRERDKIARDLIQGLQEVLAEYQRQMREKAAEYDKWITTLQRQKQQEEDKLQAFSVRLNELIGKIWGKYNEERLESTLLFDHWRTVSKPYATVTAVPPSDNFRIGQLNVEDEKIELLEREERPVGVLFSNMEMSLCCLQTEEVLSTISTGSLEIDSETAIVLLGYSGVAGCGSANAHQRCFTINFSTSDIRAGQTLYPRIAPAIVTYQGALYVFGGRNSMKAETIDLQSLSSISRHDLPIHLSRGSPCQHNGRIYLPATFIQIYTVATDSYENFMTVTKPFEFACLLVHEDRLLVFSNDYTLEKAVNSTKTTIQKAWKLNFESRPSPVLLGDSVFFFNSEYSQITKYEIK